MSFLNLQGNSDIQSKIERFCAFQERSRQEVKSILSNWGISEDESLKLIAYLIESKFLDEVRFAESFVSGKFRIKKWGRIKIKSHLRTKGIAKELIDNALKNIDPDEYWRTLQLLAQRKLEDLQKEKDKWTKRAKLQRFLASKGYEADLILDVVQLIDQ